MKKKLRVDIISLFPNVFDAYFGESIVKRAQEKKLLNIYTHNLRTYSANKHRTVDDTAYGGGPGMVVQVEPIYRAVRTIKTKSRASKKRVILFSTRGKKLTNTHAKRLASYSQLIMICGRYEGVDERVARHVADEEISIGDFILAGGELPAMITTEAVARHIPGVLGKKESLEEIKGSYPVYSRPEVFEPRVKKEERKKSWRVPKELTSGNHKAIESWRKKHS
jgi:tRNA (guanine37-N1)-methyltransferase